MFFEKGVFCFYLDIFFFDFIGVFDDFVVVDFFFVLDGGMCVVFCFLEIIIIWYNCDFMGFVSLGFFIDFFVVFVFIFEIFLVWVGDEIFDCIIGVMEGVLL